MPSWVLYLLAEIQIHDFYVLSPVKIIVSLLIIVKIIFQTMRKFPEFVKCFFVCKKWFSRLRKCDFEVGNGFLRCWECDFVCKKWFPGFRKCNFEVVRGLLKFGRCLLWVKKSYPLLFVCYLGIGIWCGWRLCKGLFFCKIHCADAKGESLPFNGTETGLVQYLLHYFALWKGLHCSW